MEPYTDIITGSSYIQVGQGRLSNGICIILLWSIKLLDYWFKRSDKYGNEIARVLRGIGDLPLTALTDESDIHVTWWVPGEVSN